MLGRVASFLTTLFLSVSATPSFAAFAVAAATSSDGVHYYWNTNQPSRKVAEQKVMKICSENAKKNNHVDKCKFVVASDGPTYVAFVHAKDGHGFGISSDPDRQQAIDRAYAQCIKYNNECFDTAAEVDFDEGQQKSHPPKPKPTPTSASDNCRPRTQEIRCQSNCVNGNCVVTYKNGCKIRVQVSPRFDSFTNQWTYPSPSC